MEFFILCSLHYIWNKRHIKRKAVWRILLVLFSLLLPSLFFFICLLQRFCTNKVLVIFELFSLWLPKNFYYTALSFFFCFLLDTLLKFWFTRFSLFLTINSSSRCVSLSFLLTLIFCALKTVYMLNMYWDSTCIDILNFLYSTE